MRTKGTVAPTFEADIAAMGGRLSCGIRHGVLRICNECLVGTETPADVAVAGSKEISQGLSEMMLTRRSRWPHAMRI